MTLSCHSSKSTESIATITALLRDTMLPTRRLRDCCFDHNKTRYPVKTTKKLTASARKSCLLHLDLLLVPWISFNSSRFNLQTFMKHLLCEGRILLGIGDTLMNTTKDLLREPTL